MTLRWKGNLGSFLILGILSALIFSSSLDNPFVFDDLPRIRDNPDLRQRELSWSQFIHNGSPLKSEYRNDPSRPLTHFFFWSLWQTQDGDPAPFRIFSILIHTLNACLAGWLAALWFRRLQKEKDGIESPLPLLFTGLLYLTLPLNAGSAIYAYALSDLLGCFFGLGLWAWVYRQKNFSVLQFLGAGLLYVLAVTSKQSAIVLPAVILVSDYFYFERQDFKKRLVLNVGLFTLAGTFLLTRYLYFGQLGDLEAYDTYPRLTYLSLQGLMIWKYLGLIFFPAQLSIDHSIIGNFPNWLCISAWGALLALTGFLLLQSRRNSFWKILNLGWIIFLLGLIPTSSIFPTTDLLVERRVYFSTVGLMIAAGCALSMLWFSFKPSSSSRKIIAALLVAAISLQSYLSWRRVIVYGNEEILWREAMAIYPLSERTRLNLVAYYLAHRDFQKGETELLELLRMYPNYYGALANLGALYQHPNNPRRDLNKAISYYAEVLKQEPYNPTALMNSGILYLELRDPQKAADSFARFLEAIPNNIQALLGLGDSALQLKQKSRALEQAQKVLQIDPQNPAGLKLLQKAQNL